MKPLTRQETRDYLEAKSKLAEPSRDFTTPMRCRPSRTLPRGLQRVADGLYVVDFVGMKQVIKDTISDIWSIENGIIHNLDLANIYWKRL